MAKLNLMKSTEYTHSTAAAAARSAGSMMQMRPHCKTAACKAPGSPPVMLGLIMSAGLLESAMPCTNNKVPIKSGLSLAAAAIAHAHRSHNSIVGCWAPAVCCCRQGLAQDCGQAAAPPAHQKWVVIGPVGLLTQAMTWPPRPVALLPMAAGRTWPR